MMLYVFNCWDTSTPEVARRSASLFQTGWRWPRVVQDQFA
jgi:hypothetical protein